MREKYGEEIITIPGCLGKVPIIDLPLEKLGTGEDWFYAATFAIFPDHAKEFKQFYAKRFALHRGDFVATNKKVNIRGGRYRSLFMNVYYRATLWVDWLVKGDVTEIRKIIKHIFFIGKKTSQGWGSVLKWEIQPHEFCVEKDGRLLRAIPKQSGEYLFAIRPPYWLYENFRQCDIPNERTNITD
ncbi:MAG: hypothetical protein N2517_09345 [Ignavibacteria bacterium]|nr:hypothetical protein [Ignavibacteria bacterium]